MKDPNNGDGRDTPILVCFSLIDADEENELSYGDRDATDVVNIDHLTLLTPNHPNSKDKFPWLTEIVQLLDQLFTTAYSDGTGRALQAAAASVSKSQRTTTPTRRHQYLGTVATVADAERMGIKLILESLSDDYTIAILSDSQAAIDTVLNLAKSKPARSGIERDIKRLLSLRQDRDQDTAIAWVWAHTQILGNAEADALAQWSSYLGQTRGSRRIITEGGVRTRAKAERKR